MAFDPGLYRIGWVRTAPKEIQTTKTTPQEFIATRCIASGQTLASVVREQLKRCYAWPKTRPLQTLQAWACGTGLGFHEVLAAKAFP
jgi:hypothetical protein